MNVSNSRQAMDNQQTDVQRKSQEQLEGCYQ